MTVTWYATGRTDVPLTNSTTIAYRNQCSGNSFENLGLKPAQPAIKRSYRHNANFWRPAVLP